jgi:RHS repeat-associated protein
LAVPSAGSYQVYARWTAHPNRATDAKYTVNHAAGSDMVTVNQEASSGAWNLLGTYDFNAGNATVRLTDQANGYVIADAVMLLPPGIAANTATWTPNVAQGGQYEVYARWTQSANRATNATYTVTHATGSSAIPVNQQQGGGTWNPLGTFSLSPGSNHKISLTDQANGFVIADAIRLVPIAVQAEQKLYFIHVDHLNTPRLVADAAGMTVWKWDQQEPFGNNVPDENSSGLGVFDLPLRLPGQYFDKETGLHYNYYRNYSPDLGRYKESDPIGLRGGRNTFAYVFNNPLRRSDILGLKPGDEFSSEEAAARDALAYFRTLYNVDRLEYAAAIYKKGNCKFSYTEPDTFFSCNTSPVPFYRAPFGVRITADIHNHPRMSCPGEDPALNEYFSDVDIAGYGRDGTSGYLITPTWRLKKWQTPDPIEATPCNCN